MTSRHKRYDARSPVQFIPFKPIFSETMPLNLTSQSSLNECFGFEFKIDNFTSTIVEEINSSDIVSSQECKTSWQIILGTEIIRTENHHYGGGYQQVTPIFTANRMKVGLRRTDSNKCDVKASLFFELQNSQNDVYLKEAITEKLFSDGKPTDFYTSWIKKPSCGSYVKGMQGTDFLLHDNQLILKGYLLIQYFCKKDNRASPMNATELQCNFKEMYQNKFLSDVVFSFGDDKLYAHKTVLSARSPVFKKMFEQNMKETNFNCVEITDIKKSEFDSFLLFLYTGVVENTELGRVMSLYSTADKYEVTTLFKTCSNILVPYISDNTASVILKLADMHSDESLKEKTVQFICENFTKIEETVEWNNLLDTDPRLASYTLKMVSSSVAAKEKNML